MIRTSEATTSKTHACAHVLRHLRNPAELRNNPLVGRLFGEEADAAADRRISRRIEAIVRAAAEALRADGGDPHSERQYRILNRCDLEGRLHAEVAGELGLSIRQFYREREAARSFVAAFLIEHMRVLQQPVTDVLDPAVYVLAQAARLRGGGDDLAALTHLQRLIHHTEDPMARVRALCESSAAYVDLHRYDEALASLQEARRQSAQGTEAYVNIAWGSYLWACGDPAGAIATTESGIHALRGARTVEPRAGVDEVLARALIDHAEALCGVGQFDKSAEYLKEAAYVLDRMVEATPELRAAYHIAFGCLQSVGFGALATSADTLRAALTIARDHGLGKYAVFAMAGLSVQADFGGDRKRAMAYIREALRTAMLVLPSYDLDHIWLRVAELESEGGDSHDALKITESLRARFAPNSRPWIKTVLFEGRALLRSGQHERALQRAEQAVQAASTLNDQRLCGASLQTSALAQAALGLRNNAQRSIAQSIEMLERRGSALLLMRAYESSGRLTHSRRHAAYANDLRRMLSNEYADETAGDVEALT